MPKGLGAHYHHPAKPAASDLDARAVFFDLSRNLFATSQLFS
jgi:hypothetical protein